ncbi:MAG: DUF2892 domain-containing protein [Gammaproteobacteria bacterium]|nr:MAG: DUF2892 domain-containing protein [Gammaproteobacteria bacterium]
MHNLNQRERILRAAVAAALIGTPFLVEGPVHGLAWLPLLGIYPALTAWLGWDPIKGALARPARRPIPRGEAANEPRYSPGRGEEGQRRRAA